jgi:hypothetical protein
MGVSVGGTSVWVGTMDGDVGELQDNTMNRTEMKVMPRFMIQIIWQTKKEGRNNPALDPLDVYRLWSEPPEFASFNLIPRADQDATLELQGG